MNRFNDCDDTILCNFRFFCLDQVLNSVGAALGENKLAAVFCVAGGWAGGSAADAGVLFSLVLIFHYFVESILSQI